MLALVPAPSQAFYLHTIYFRLRQICLSAGIRIRDVELPEPQPGPDLAIYRSPRLLLHFPAGCLLFADTNKMSGIRSNYPAFMMNFTDLLTWDNPDYYTI
jgi:hypothetical protein